MIYLNENAEQILGVLAAVNVFVSLIFSVLAFEIKEIAAYVLAGYIGLITIIAGIVLGLGWTDKPLVSPVVKNVNVRM